LRLQCRSCLLKPWQNEEIMVWSTTKEKVKRLSERIVDAQKPIRILDAIKWEPWVEEKLKKSKFKDVPKLGPDYYQKIELGYDPKLKIDELRDIITDIDLDLGRDDELGGLLKEIVGEYIEVVRMITQRGTKKFGEASRKLYGSPKDTLYDDKSSILDLGRTLYEILGKMGDSAAGREHPEDVEAKEVVRILNERFKNYFQDDPVRARISDGIVADAAAGSDFVKIRENALFSMRDVDILEVHEGWVHVGTTQNGNSQTVAKWLAKGPPRCASTQEGLAVFMEIFSFRSYPRRAKAINDRILGIDKVEDGADILQLLEFYRTEGYSEEDALTSVKRIFRGGAIEGGAPFTKDIAYCKGFIENYNFMRAAIQAGYPYLIPFLFVGKIHSDDIPLLYRKYKEGIVDPPRYLPPQFADLDGLAVWMSFSSFLNQIDMKRVRSHYEKIFENSV